jgi:hypothetical protein
MEEKLTEKEILLSSMDMIPRTVPMNIGTDIVKDGKGGYTGSMKLDALVETGKDIIFENDGDPYNIALSLPPTLVPILESLSDELRYMPEDELAKMFRPKLRDYIIKKSFWLEWVKSLTDGRRMIIRNVVGGFSGSIKHFSFRCKNNPYFLAWLVKPEYEYQAYLEAVCERAKVQLWMILDSDVCNEKGRLDPQKAKIVVDVAKYVMDRKNGEPVKRIDKRMVSFNFDKDPRIEVEKIDEKLEKIEEMSGMTKEYISEYEPMFIEPNRE